MSWFARATNLEQTFGDDVEGPIIFSRQTIVLRYVSRSYVIPRAFPYVPSATAAL
jgi:hypothetical protein